MPDSPISSFPDTPNGATQSFADASPAADTALPALGAVGRYTVLHLHATGGLGEVYLAHDEELGRDVALKRIQERHAHDASSVRRFLQEAEITARLEHPAVVPVHGLVRDEAGRNSHWGRAKALDQLRRYTEAATDWERASELADGPQRPFLQLQRAISLAHAGDHAQAATIAEALTVSKPSGDTLYNAACVFALCATAGPPDPKCQEGQVAKAVALLRRAQAAGYFKDPAHVAHLKKDSDLHGLRGRADFQAFVRELGAARSQRNAH